MAMLKRLKVEGDRVDRLSDLPINVKHQIQQNLLIDDAARMSVLSTVWRHVWPSIPELSFASGTEVERLPTRLDNVKFVRSYIDFDDEDQVSSILRILTSTPNVKDLILDVWSSEIKGGMEEDVNHFEGPAYGTQEFNKLQKLKIAAFRGLKPELLFVRFILRSAPLLLKTILFRGGPTWRSGGSPEPPHRKITLYI
ncbi:hypothetical protein KY290_024474 [Solanum tuberosum]|uniref:F-box family protein n=1 Tax=Solanum tuberosum TaxID=4113 RepID=A0ABQ7UR05_SOLTU|nr:hypothetical protein KY290_024474 [Solanum tuberosum]